eukprot:g51401.t1
MANVNKAMDDPSSSLRSELLASKDDEFQQLTSSSAQTQAAKDDSLAAKIAIPVVLGLLALGLFGFVLCWIKKGRVIAPAQEGEKAERAEGEVEPQPTDFQTHDVPEGERLAV